MQTLFRVGVISMSVSLLGDVTLRATEPPAEDAGASPKVQEANEPEKSSANTKKEEATSSSSSSASSKSEKPQPKYRPYSVVLKDAKKIPGLITLHRKDDKLYAELSANQFNRDFIVLITIARGIGQQPIFGGFSWGFGDDWVWQFRKAGEKIHLVRRNVRFTAKKGSPTADAVKLSYTDSVLFSLPIATKSPSGATVVDLTSVFMSDLPQISQWLSGFSFSRAKSTWADVKGYPKNVELQVAATYASSGRSTIESVPDSRGVTVHVHYSISALPKTDYRPRLADDRIGYFLTVVKDFSKNDDLDEHFVRYINRWNLKKIDPKADVSPPKKPIVFYLEKTIPFKYRKPIRDGILEWNKAFEKIGFYDAIEVRQQDGQDGEEGADKDPGDVRYNFFRWITSGQGFAMGPSRVNPTTGEILDADIIFDADFLQFWKREYETFTPKGIEVFTGGPLDLKSFEEQRRKDMGRRFHSSAAQCACNLLNGTAHQLALSSAVLAARTQNPADLNKLIMQALKDTAMHEVGHTLGLRHNFKASTLYSIEDANNVDKTRSTGLTASVMDYTPVNIVPRDMKQGDYYSTTIGPYDYWAIEYGYKPLSGGSSSSELPELKKIAARSGEPGLAYATDEDVWLVEPDPTANRWDFGDDTTSFAEMQAKLVAETWPEIIDRMTDDGNGYQLPRRAFGVLLGTHGRAMFIAARQVGGLYKSRSHKGDKDARKPFEVVPAKKQRQAFQLVADQVFSDRPFQFPPELYNSLAPSHWNHWGTQMLARSDYPAHAVILMWQDRILQHLLSSLTLSRLHDSELKVPLDEDAFTVAELLERLTDTIFAEIDDVAPGEYSNRKPAISSLRRNLQRSYLRELAYLTLGYSLAPEDCQTIAYVMLSDLQGKIDKLLERDLELDSYSRAHLVESSAKIGKVLDSRISQLP